MSRFILIVILLAAAMPQAKAADCGEAKVRAWARDTITEAVVVGRIISVGRPPLYWSGQFAAWQRVEYQVEGVLKGRIPERIITVAYAIVSGDELVNGKKPQLSPKIFREGSRQIVFLTPNGNYTFRDEKRKPAKVYLGGGICPLAKSDRLLDVIRETLAAG